MSSTLSRTSTIIRSALVLESVANIGAAVCTVVLPNVSLGALGIKAPTVLAKQLIMYFGGCVIALTVPLVMSLPNEPGIVRIRRVTYATMLGGEVALLLIMIAQGSGWMGYAGDSARIVGGATLGKKAAEVLGGKLREEMVQGGPLWFAMGNMAVLAVWRAVCLFVKPEWMGKEGEGRKKLQ